MKYTFISYTTHKTKSDFHLLKCKAHTDNRPKLVSNCTANTTTSSSGVFKKVAYIYWKSCVFDIVSLCNFIKRHLDNIFNHFKYICHKRR